MNTTRTLALAAVTALSLGIGSAMAQEGPTVDSPTDWASVPTVTASNAGVYRGTGVVGEMPQAGSSDRVVPAVNYDAQQGIAAAGGGG